MSAVEVIFFASRDKRQQVRLFVPTTLYMYIISTVYSIKSGLIEQMKGNKSYLK
jgi:hypothetical protein